MNIILNIVLIIATFTIGVFLGKMIEYLFEVRVKQFQDAIWEWVFPDKPTKVTREDKKTIFFEEKYGVNIDNLKSTAEVDEVIEKSIGRTLEVKKMDIFPIVKYDIEEKIDKALKIGDQK
jgi:hypothetical protein